MLKIKVSSTESKVILTEVNPMNTTKTCSKCGNIQDMKLNDREYNCKNCENIMDRDYNSVINILRIGEELTFVENKVTNSMKQESPSFMVG